MVSIDLTVLPGITAHEAFMLTGVEEASFTKPGIYHVMTTSWGEICGIEFLDKVETVEVATLEEIIEAEADDEIAEQYFTEFYGIHVEEDHINFGYTEEAYDVWFKIA